MIETAGLTRHFAAGNGWRALLPPARLPTVTAVDNVSLRIEAGELFGLLGPNGAGKSTLVKLLCTLILPSAGRAGVAGFDVARQAGAVRQRVGLVDTHERSFFWRLTGRQNLEFFAALQGLRGAAAHRRLVDMLELTGLTGPADRRVMHYSTGERQKLAVARSLLAMPPVLFMDEPTRSLDPTAAAALRVFIRHTLVNRLGRTVVLVTHQLAEAEAMCDRLAIMSKGRVVACGTTGEITTGVQAASLAAVFERLAADAGRDAAGAGFYQA
jgi:ABC-2 type transport system ATP-binding protein